MSGRLLERILESGLGWVLYGRQRLPAEPFDPSQVRRILVVRKDNIGDVLCTTPALRALRRAFPGAHLAILVSRHCRAVVERNPDVDDVFTYTKAKHDSRWFGVPVLWQLMWVLRELRARRFDLVIAMGRPCSRSSAWLAYATGAPWRLGYLGSASSPFSFFLNLRQEVEAMETHEVDGCLGLLASIGVSPAGRELTLIPDPEAQRSVQQRLGGTRVEGGDRLALIHISCRREDNRWPLPAFAQAADALHERLGLSILLSWAPGDAKNPLFPGEDGKAEEVAARMRARPVLLRTPTLAELIAAVSLSDFVLSPDGGLMHIAAALQVPQVALFGGPDPRQWRPVNPKSLVLRRGFRVDQIRVEEVVEAAMNVMSQWGPGKALAAQPLPLGQERHAGL
jgi:ADP-heptose:LPS heptosyltransferase